MTDRDDLRVLSFRWTGRYAHFRRAESSRDGLTYPVPPRTAVVGLLGAVLGLEKDRSPHTLANLKVACSGVVPRTFWHRIKLRKDPPASLPRKVKARSPEKTRSEPPFECPNLMMFEYLWRPDYRIDVMLPDRPDLLEDLEGRIRERRWHFTPCLGLSELLADLEYVGTCSGVPLQPGHHEVHGVIPQDQVRLVSNRERLSVRIVRMPRAVDEDRRFEHENFLVESQGRPVPVETSAAIRVNGRALILQ